MAEAISFGRVTYPSECEVKKALDTLKPVGVLSKVNYSLLYPLKDFYLRFIEIYCLLTDADRPQSTRVNNFLVK